VTGGPPGVLPFDLSAGSVYLGPMDRLVPAIVSACLASTGCTVVLDPAEAQCETTADCTNRGFKGAVCTKNVCEAVPPPPPDPTWGCLGHVVAPTPDPTKTVTLKEQVILALDKSPVAGATIDVCDKLDIDCVGMNPLDPKGLTTDANGYVTFNVAQGFDGFVRITDPTIMDSRVFVGRPILTPPNVKAIEVLRPMDYSLLATVAKQTVDMNRGTAIVLAFDCQGDSGAGVSFKCAAADSETQVFYLINMAPNTPPAATATDVDGFGGFFNLPVGAAIVESYRGGGAQYIGQSSFDVLAYTISYVLVAPTPN
jgi:hypothetical protein